MNGLRDYLSEDQEGPMHRWQVEGLTDEELLTLIDQSLASLHVRITDPEGDWTNWPELAEAIDATCDEWDRFADGVPGFRANG